MSERAEPRSIAGRAAALTVLALLAMLIEAAPLGVAPLSLPSPDIVVCLVALWAIRAPEATPLVLVFALGLMRDLLTDLPPGLGALTLVAVAEALKSRAELLSRQPFVVEWIWVALGAALMSAAQWLGLLLSFAQPPYASLLAQQVTATVALYPLVTAVCYRLLRGRRRAG